MNEPRGDVNITNPMYTGYDDDDGPDFGEDFDSDKVNLKPWFKLKTMAQTLNSGSY